ncbi:ABC-type transport system involved in resistance to organic solvents, periplasmic component USSDB6C [Pseudomonas sp. 8BK]|uniref:MlaD family protein n=1 Tax=Pseudomonas sp. 8BK TaxID=2653164 RepID=UPI0012F2C04D|nr:MlaD family protein [Pseudomonas sp. 8BK]VXB32209.1 ABC-type transport system involved in resistance to organic solvents, periplasmic component USSDB6C [Pseudomonas sp. 8BK]
MEPRAHHVLIGLFTVLMVAAALGFALWLSKASSDQELNDYDVIFTEAVSGLSQGSAVQYSGIKVGDVISLRLDPQDPRKVRAHIRVNANTPIKEDTRARLSITGITGAALIQLHSGSPESPMLISKGDQRAEIIADRSPLSRLMSNGEDLVLSVTRLLNRANQLFSRDNIGSISRTLENIEQTSASVAEQRDELRTALQQMSSASQEAANLMRNANQLLSGQGREAMDSANRLLTSLERSSSNVERLLSDNRAALDGGMQGIGELGPTIIELRETLSALRSFARRLEEDPAGYLLRSDTIKEFQP